MSSFQRVPHTKRTLGLLLGRWGFCILPKFSNFEAFCYQGAAKARRFLGLQPGNVSLPAMFSSQASCD